MEQSPWSKINCLPHVQETPRIYGTWRFISALTRPADDPYPEPDESSAHLPTLLP